MASVQQEDESGEGMWQEEGRKEVLPQLLNYMG